MKLVFAQNWLTIRCVALGFKEAQTRRLVRLGTYYGGWYVPQAYLDSKASKTLLSLGVGFDVSFDKEMSKAGFNLILVDPIPDCITFAQKQLSEFSNCYFENMAVSNFTGSELFYSPRNSQHDSWSSINIQSTSAELAQNFEVVTLDALLVKYDSIISKNLVYLKMDIEGAEVKLISQICNQQKVFGFIGIELDFLSLIPFLDLKNRIRSVILARKFLKDLDSKGYKLICHENFNFFWDGSDDA